MKWKEMDAVTRRWALVTLIILIPLVILAAIAGVVSALP